MWGLRNFNPLSTFSHLFTNLALYPFLINASARAFKCKEFLFSEYLFATIDHSLCQIFLPAMSLYYCNRNNLCNLIVSDYTGFL